MQFRKRRILLNLESRVAPRYEKSYTLLLDQYSWNPNLDFRQILQRCPWWALERQRRNFALLSELPLATGNPLRFARPIVGGETSDRCKILRNAPWRLWGAKSKTSQNSEICKTLFEVAPGYEKSYTHCQTNTRGCKMWTFCRFRNVLLIRLWGTKGTILRKSRIY